MSLSSLSSVANSIVSFFSSFVQAITHVLGEDGTIVAVLAGASLLVSMLLGMFDEVPIIGDFLQKIGL